MAEEVVSPGPEQTGDAKPTAALAGWEALRYSVDHVLVRDLLHVQAINADTRAVLARGR